MKIIMKIIIAIKILSRAGLALFTLCLLGNEPEWYLGRGWIVCLGLLIMSTVLIMINNKCNEAQP